MLPCRGRCPHPPGGCRVQGAMPRRAAAPPTGPSGRRPRKRGGTGRPVSGPCGKTGPSFGGASPGGRHIWRPYRPSCKFGPVRRKRGAKFSRRPIHFRRVLCKRTAGIIFPPFSGGSPAPQGLSTLSTGFSTLCYVKYNLARPCIFLSEPACQGVWGEKNHQSSIFAGTAPISRRAVPFFTGKERRYV